MNLGNAELREDSYSIAMHSGLATMEGHGLEASSFEFGVTPFYFLRHGETRENEEGIVQGQNDTRLIAKGRQSAQRAGEALGGVLLRSIYASPLERAWQTATIVSILTGVPAFPMPGLMERNWGPYQGGPKDLRPAEPDPEAVESHDDFSSRVLTAMRSINGPSPVLVVAHSGVFRVLCRHAKLSENPAVSVSSGMAVKFEPPGAQRRRWHISVVG
ncbi:MAG: histidine phosphatase family protein [Inquilinus sp.]|nr:histidine phosphatase family protein [Inquilinus sp.]